MQAEKSAATLLALLYALLIAYASLYPFEGWRDQGIPPLGFLNAPWPRYWSRFDIVANFLGYMPLGFLLALALMRSTLQPRPVLVAVLMCILFSLLLETLQNYLPLRVPQLSDGLLNSAGALVGGVVALVLERLGLIEHWSRFRARWFTRNAQGALVLLALWPAALIVPPALPLSLGQVRQRLHETLDDWLQDSALEALISAPRADLPPLSNVGELICVALGFVIPCFLAYAVTLGWQRRLVLWCVGVVLALGASSLSAALSYSPANAWGWLSLASKVGLAVGIVIALLSIVLPRRLCWALLVVALVWQLSWINSAPETPYFAQTLQSWEQGSFVRFHGLAQWLGWLWPFATLAASLEALVRHESGLGNASSR